MSAPDNAVVGGMLLLGREGLPRVPVAAGAVAVPAGHVARVEILATSPALSSFQVRMPAPQVISETGGEQTEWRRRGSEGSRALRRAPVPDR